MDVTLLGIVADVSPLQPPKAFSPMHVTSLGMTVLLHPLINLFFADSIMALQLLRESYLGLASSTKSEFNPLQNVKAALPMDVTLLGMVTDVSPLQPANAK